MLASDRPVITSPEHEAVYALQDGIPKSYQRILLEASLPAGADRAHWFVDHQWYATCDATERIFYTPTKGKHHLMCLDDQGRSKSIRFEVR